MKYDLISRKDAHEQNLKRFYTGKPCSHGHDAQRFVTTGGCVACNADRSRAFSKLTNSTQGRFTYALHPDDYAAAFAYCQALDLQRGRVPETPKAPRGAEPVALPAEIVKRRGELIRQYGPSASSPYLPKP